MGGRFALTTVVSLILGLSLRVYIVGGESPQDHMAKERIKIACHVQQLPVATKMFDECLEMHKMPYSIRKVFAPCSKLAGINLKSYDGIFNFTCKEQGKQRNKVITCVVNNIAAAAKTNDIVQFSQKALEVAKECSNYVLKAVADEAAEKAKKAWEASMAKAGQGFQMPKTG